MAIFATSLEAYMRIPAATSQFFADYSEILRLTKYLITFRSLSTKFFVGGRRVQSLLAPDKWGGLEIHDKSASTVLLKVQS